jgi:HEAT repeat protein
VRCLHCGYDLAEYQALDYEGKLLLATRHPISDQRMMAVWTLGERRSQRAIPIFARLLEQHIDPYLAGEILAALVKIGGPESKRLLEQAAQSPSAIIQKTAANCLAHWPETGARATREVAE